MESIKSGFKSFLAKMKPFSDNKDGREDTENDVPSKKRRKQDDHTVNLCPIINPVNKSTSSKAATANTLEGLLSDLTNEQNLNEILEKSSWQDNIFCPRILKTPQGALADEFQKYLKSRTENEDEKMDMIKKFSFLILTEIILQCKDPAKQALVFDHLVSVFFDEKSQYYISLKNDLIADELADESISNENVVKYLRLAKADANVWEGGKGCLVPVYNVEFRNSPEFKAFCEKNVFVACLLSIL